MLTSTEWVKISHALEGHHALFNQCWQMGRPVFTDSIPTAAVSFLKKTGEYLNFLFNPKFWAGLTPYERLFVISHECLHVMLNHGLRTVDSKDSLRTNWALDIVVNHMLCNSFGFDRSLIKDEAELCWVDTVFKDHPNIDKIPTDGSFEYYLTMIPKRPTFTLKLVDDHSSLPDNWKNVIGKLNGRLSAEELDTLQDAVEKHCQNPSQIDGASLWTFVDPGLRKKNRKWETIIKDWSKMYLREVTRNREQWLRVNRRFWSIQGSLLLPSENEEIDQQGDKVGVFFFMDTSGSCYHLKERFFKAALSLPEERFIVRLFCFDERVEETSLESKQIYGGAGTLFGIIEDKILEVCAKESGDYPEAVFVITDGHGSHVQPKQPDRWHWFLSGGSTPRFIPKKSKKYDLSDFE